MVRVYEYSKFDAGDAASGVARGGRGGADAMTAAGNVDLGGVSNLDLHRRGEAAMRGGDGAAADAVRGGDGAAADAVRGGDVTVEVEITDVLKNNKGVDAVLTIDGKVIKGTFTPEELASFSGKSLDDITKMMDDVQVKDAAKLKADDLKKLGAAGSLTAFVVFLMLATGEMNPVKAIEKTLEAAAKKAVEVTEAGGDVVANLLKKMFGSFQGFLGVSAMFIFISCVMVILWLIMSVVLKK